MASPQDPHPHRRKVVVIDVPKGHKRRELPRNSVDRQCASCAHAALGRRRRNTVQEGIPLQPFLETFEESCGCGGRVPVLREWDLTDFDYSGAVDPTVQIQRTHQATREQTRAANQSERDRNLRGKKNGAGAAPGNAWRGARSRSQRIRHISPEAEDGGNGRDQQRGSNRQCSDNRQGTSIQRQIEEPERNATGQLERAHN
jgi:hypothetical protein